MANGIELRVLLGLVQMDISIGVSMANCIELMVLLGLVQMDISIGGSMAKTSPPK